MIERNVRAPRPKYEATVTTEGSRITAHVIGDTVELTRPSTRAILRVPVEEWNAFIALVDHTSHALVEKLTIEGSDVVLPWLAAPAVDEAAALLVERAGGDGPDDEFSAPPVVPGHLPGTPVPPRVSA